MLVPGFVLASPVQPAAAASTNSVIVWDEYAQKSIWDVAAQGPNVQGRSFTMVHGAIYDAVNAISGKPYQPYLVAPPATGTESKDAAVAAAAHQVLLSLFPGQQPALQAQYDAYLAGIPDGPAKTGGIAIGNQAAAAMIAARVNDGYLGPQTWVHGATPGAWRPVPPNFGSDGAWTGFMKPFAIPSAAAFRTAGPPALTSNAYTKDFNEVKKIGAVNSTTRTADQTDSARWWHDRRLTEWEIKRQVATNRGLNTLQAARMFAMADVAATDAVIACYEDKYFWNFWRPVTAIQLADTDGNAATVADPTWMPVLVTPPFPDHPSGHTCYTAATMATLAYFYQRDNISFSAFSPASNSTRSFTSFSSALIEVINARVWGGIHFRTADNQGALLGAKVAAYTIAHYFRPS
ncbi:hypothetical protein Prum_078720 [Phytohabitans rumicis]|uniref:Phosphatidic acid phosphatase type 2/haloperoxidase domain-containing protein n=1 Tax=Phytohabitans rumicis TaxID=1076125 RepID=A0A6V8LEY7_9ACTN|nr:hypothetical protein Prum_078720 [Phytohabitans rumicis]